MESIDINSLWVLIAAVFVMLMQAGFTMVEVGFTRAKNAVNIIMKNFVDFSIGSILFWFVGFTIMFGTDIAGFMGIPEFGFNKTGAYGITDKAGLIFQTVFLIFDYRSFIFCIHLISYRQRVIIR